MADDPAFAAFVAIRVQATQLSALQVVTEKTAPASYFSGGCGRVIRDQAPFAASRPGMNG